ncbi:FimV/HubP family polar landmark protein [Azotobacter bryophylli]|uniref:FimV/HubP family polar landmark protein n=1 Tax=Azotobacter bryophylli TaxID=1986537 RepID=A0ABV7AVZ3_9GAMM
MVRVRKLVLAIAAASALSSGMAHALGLGEITLHSALNQPLDADIEVLDIRDLESNELVPSLASPEEFNKAGVDRQYFLTDLKFTPVIKPNGKSIIRVTSTKPVREPYLNFLVEVLWPNGRLLREYTLLLDPPLYSPQTVSAAPQAPRIASRPSSSASRVPVAPAPAPVVEPAPRSAEPRPATADSLSGNEYRTSRNDTLWEVAERVHRGSSVHQTMLAIQDLNPDAFIDGNINRMRSGHVLRLPDQQQIRSRSQEDALAQVAAQNAAWREGRSRPSLGSAARQLDATRRTEAGAAPAQIESKDSLHLVSAESGKATSGSDKGGDGESAASRLALTQESLDTTQRENAELKSRMTDLESQLEKLQRLIQLKDSQLAKMQANLAQPDTGVADAAANAEPSVESAASPAVATSAQPAAPIDKAVTSTPADTTAGGAALMPPSEVQPAPVVEVKPAPTQPKPAPVQPAAPQGMEVPPASLLDALMENPLLLGSVGGGSLLALLLALMTLTRRRAAKEEEKRAARERADSFNLDPVLDDLPTSLAATPLASQEQQAAQSGDVLGEADIYIAYGRFNKAAELLQAASNDEPNRRDLRLKLMEVYAELGDREGFARQEKELREIGGAQPQIDQLNAKYPAMAAFAATALAVAAMANAIEETPPAEPEPQPATTSNGKFDAEREWTLDDLEAELEKDLQCGAGGDQPVLLLDDGDLDGEPKDVGVPVVEEPLDFSFDLDLPEDAPVTEQVADASDALDLTLDLETPALSDDAEDNEFLLNLEDELPLVAETIDKADVPKAAESSDEDLFAELDLSDFNLDEEKGEPELSNNYLSELDELDAELEQLTAGLGGADDAAPSDAFSGKETSEEEGFDFLIDADETATKLDLARAYIEMGDNEGARDILDEVLNEGNESQQQEAREMFSRLV